MRTCFTGHCDNNAEEATIYCLDCSAYPKSAIPKEEIEKLAEDVLTTTFKKAVETLGDDFYGKLRWWLSEHSDQYETKIMDDAIGLLSDKRWLRHRNHRDMRVVRAKIYEEHKAEIDQTLSEELIQNNIKAYLGLFLCDENKTKWRYEKLEGALAKWVIENYSKSEKLQKAIDKELTRQNARLLQENEGMKKDIARLQEIIGNYRDSNYS